MRHKNTICVNIRLEACDVFVGRPSCWGNPFIIGRDGSRVEVIEKYRRYLLGNPGLLARLPQLRGKRLGCYCAPLPCHGHILAQLADSIPKPKRTNTVSKVKGNVPKP